LDVNEVASFLKMSTSHVYTLTSSKKIPHIKLLGKKVLFDKAEILDWLKSKKVSAK
jgi:excisionase family DNA binding protein